MPPSYSRICCLSFGLFAAVLTIGIVTTKAQVNLLDDPGFESGSFSGGWYGDYSGSQFSQDHVRSGNWSMKLTADSSNGSLVLQCPVIPGPGEYRLTGWGMTPTRLGLWSAQFSVVGFMEAPWQGGTTPLTSYLGLNQYSEDTPGYAVTGVWTYFDTGILTAPANSGSVYIDLFLGYSSNSATLYLDDLSFVRVVPEPSSLAIFALGFLTYSFRAKKKFAVAALRFAVQNAH